MPEVSDVAGPAQLTRRQVADRVGLTYGTFNQYLHQSRQRLADGLPLRPTDAPLEDGRFGSTPYWLESTVVAWLAARAGSAAGVLFDQDAFVEARAEWYWQTQGTDRALSRTLAASDWHNGITDPTYDHIAATFRKDTP